MSASTLLVSRACMLLQDLSVTIRQRAYKRRVLTRTMLAFSERFQIAVAVYALVQPATKTSYQWVHRRDLGQLRSETALICADTGELMLCRLGAACPAFCARLEVGSCAAEL